MQKEKVTEVKNYRGLVIEQITRDSGSNTYNIKNVSGSYIENALASWGIAQSIIDAEVDNQRGFYHD